MKSITLEMSLKPFKKTDDNYIKEVLNKLFDQWKPLIKTVPQIQILLWTADGSELFDYDGNPDTSFEWAYLIGGANPKKGDPPFWSPDGDALHYTNFKYIENPPVMTYGILKTIVDTIKATAKEFFPDKTIKVGTTVDIGPEFAKSDFKYKRHPELCTGQVLDGRGMLCAYQIMHEDNYPYKSYPKGVPEGTPFGTFFGKQANAFLTDMGFDYIWMSNGLGFGRDTWSPQGALFDGHQFDINDAEDIKKDVVSFWTLFQAECKFPIEVRGTNMSVGIDSSTDGVPLSTIYEKVSNILPPPNSPWAALNGDFGLELMGYMSRIAEVPNDEYLFRFYVHDPWWVNSPWYDRYGGQPHDIYLPLAISRIDENGNVKCPTHINLLTVDNSFGDMPDSCANEPVPHLLKALKDSPDEPSPLVWVYPFREYLDLSNEDLASKMYAEDWFIASSIQNGFPLSTVTSTDSFIKQNKDIYKASIIVTPVPRAGSEFEKSIISYVKDGGKVIFYGNPDNAGKDFLDLTSLKITDGIEGDLPLKLFDKEVGKIHVSSVLCGGKVNTISGKNNVFASTKGYALGIYENNFVWINSLPNKWFRKEWNQVTDIWETEYFKFPSLMNKALSLLGTDISFEKPDGVETPKITLHRSNNAFIFSCFMPSNTVKTTMEFPLGAPVLNGYDTVVENSRSSYVFPKAEHKECRVFVKQKSGIVKCDEEPPVSAAYRRIIKVRGLDNAKICFFPENYCKDNIRIFKSRFADGLYDEVKVSATTKDGLTYYEIDNANDTLYFAMPYKENRKL